MGEAAEHRFNKKHASPALCAAMRGLAERTGRGYEELDGMRLGDAYALAASVYADELPEFWRIWNDWNESPEEPQPMGEL